MTTLTEAADNGQVDGLASDQSGDDIIEAIREEHGTDIADKVQYWTLIGQFSTDHWGYTERANMMAIDDALAHAYGNTRHLIVDMDPVWPEASMAFLIVNPEHPDIVGLATELYVRHCKDEDIDPDMTQQCLVEMATDEWLDSEDMRRLDMLAENNLPLILGFDLADGKEPPLPEALIPVFGEQYLSTWHQRGC